MRGRRGLPGRKGRTNVRNKCPKCGFVSKSKGGLKQHIKRKHGH